MAHSRRIFINKLIMRTAQASIGPSALRNQGASGVIEAARDAASRVDLHRLGRIAPAKFPGFLDEITAQFLSEFPAEARNWGAARKAANLFLRDATYNVDLAAAFHLGSMRPFLEVPLDQDVATGLRGQREGAALPRWTSIKGLLPQTSTAYQVAASAIALRYGVERVDLDVYFWRKRDDGET